MVSALGAGGGETSSKPLNLKEASRKFVFGFEASWQAPAEASNFRLVFIALGEREDCLSTSRCMCNVVFVI